MDRRALVGLAVAAMATSALAGRPLHPDEAAVIGAWEAVSTEGIDGLAIAPVHLNGGCLRLKGPGDGFMIEDHASVDQGRFWRAHRITPGLYAIAGVKWSSGGYPTGYAGLSRAVSPLWVFKAVPGVVTYIGVWKIRKSYDERYELAGPETTVSPGEADGVSMGVGPVMVADPAQKPVGEARGPCPA